MSALTKTDKDEDKRDPRTKNKRDEKPDPKVTRANKME